MNHLQITFFPSARLFLQLLCTATLVLSGCSGGGGGATKATTITVIEGYIQGATVCVDINKHGACDDGETKGTTGADGKVTLYVPVDDVGKYPIVAYVPADAIDSDTGEAVGTAFTLKAPKEHSGVVSPFTSLVVQKLDANKNLSLADAQSQVANSTDFEVSELSSDFMSKTTARTLARTIVALQKNRLSALNTLKNCTASQADKESQVLSAISSAASIIKTTSNAITACSTGVAQKTRECRAAIDTAVTTIVNANTGLSTTSLQNNLSAESCHILVNKVSASNSTPNIWDEFTLTLDKVWSTVKKVVFSVVNSAADLAEPAADYTAIKNSDDLWNKVSMAFKTSGLKTITAKFFDTDQGTPEPVDTTTVQVKVGSASVTQTATIDDVKDGTTTVSDNGTTTNTKPTISGKVSSSLGKYYKVNLYDGSTLLAANMVYNSDRTSWTFTPDTAFSAGSHSLTAKVATFDGGATGKVSNTKTFIVKLASLLTDTGITSSQCYGAGNNTLISCASAEATSLNSQQDGMVGRDVTSSDGTDGKLGFSFSEVPKAVGEGNYARTECVKDNITGLMWEGKPATGSSRGSPPLNYNGYYTNYVTGTDAQVKANSNAQGYVNAVNAAGLCGHKDWRLPTASELQSIVDYGVSPGPTINADWFPNTEAQWYWTSSPYVGNSSNGWGVNFNDGNVDSEDNSREYGNYVRLVR